MRRRNKGRHAGFVLLGAGVVLALWALGCSAQATKYSCDLTIEKSVAPNPLVSGQQAVYTITVTNLGTGACPGGTKVTDTGAPGLAFVSASGVGWICIGATCTYLAPIPAGGSVTVTYTYNVTAAPGTPVTNCATVTNPEDARPDNNKFCLSTKVVAPPGRCDLTCTVKVTPDPLVSGQAATFTVTVTNVGTAACSVSNQVVVPAVPGLSFVSASGVGWTCTPMPGQVICNYPGTIPPNGSATVALTYNVTASPGTMIVFCSSVANKDDANPENNRCCTRVPVVGVEGKCDLVCKKKIEPHPAMAGYLATITVQNVGSGPCPGPTWVTDPGIPGLTFISASGPGWSCVGNTCSYAAAIPPGGSATVTYTYAGTLPPGTWDNCATIENRNDVNPENNKCCQSLVVPPAVAFCCELTCQAGIEDNFSPAGTEANNAPPEWYAPEQTTPFVGFDFTGTDRWFGHRFVLPQGCQITGAQLIVRVKPIGGDSSNDSLVLRIGNNEWIARFGPPGTLVLQGTTWTVANFSAGNTFPLNLASLPGGMNLLPSLHAQRLLDVIVQDDTSVDFVRLIVQICNCP